MKKRVLITGSAGGIGRAIAERFAKEGEFDLILHAREETEDFLRYINWIKATYNVTVLPIYFDMTDYEMMKKKLQKLHQEKVFVDVLVNNAGVAHGGFFQMTSISEMKRVFEINYFSMVCISQLISRMMIRRKQGTIVNLASVAGLDLEVGNCAYGVSKAAVIAFTKTAAKELASQGIRINAVAPGLTDTRMAMQMEKHAGEEMINASAMKRLGNTNEIAETVYFLASEKASFITGQTIRVDGGM